MMALICEAEILKLKVGRGRPRPAGRSAGGCPRRAAAPRRPHAAAGPARGPRPRGCRTRSGRAAGAQLNKLKVDSNLKIQFENPTVKTKPSVNDR